MPRSLILLVALLLSVASAAAAAQWSDVIYSWWFTTNVSRLCALDAPAVCVYFPRLHLNATDFNKTWAYIGDNVRMPLTRFFYYDFDLLQFVVRSTPPRSVAVRVPAPGYIFATSSGFFVNGMSADQVNICGRSGFGVYVPAGEHVVTNVRLPLYFVGRDCVFRRLGDHVSNVRNATTLNNTIISVFYMPTAREKKTLRHVTPYYDIFNGSSHVYFVAAVYFDIFIAPAGRGFYIANGTFVDAAAFVEVASHTGFWYLYGPLGHDLWRNAALNTGGSGEFRFYSIGPAPGDGIVRIALPDYRNATVVYLSDGVAGYMKIERRPPRAAFLNSLKIYAGRYALVEVAVETADGRLYGARTLACPAYNPTPSTSRLPIHIRNLTRLDRAKEVEICNFNEYTVYVGLYLTGGTTTYVHIDAVEPGGCRRLRWDGVLPNTATQIHVFRNASAACNVQIMLTIPGRNYTAGWRYALTGNRLVSIGPIDPDVYYADAWKQIVLTMAQLHRNTTEAFLRWLSALANATGGAASIQSYISSRPQFLGTIRVDAATSTWLHTTLNELQRWRVAAPPTGGGVSASLPAPSALTASVAAAAVATAWAASRRSLATAAFLAGFAVLASALFVYYLHDTSVAAALIFAAVLLMSIGAAAAWFRKSED